MVQVEQVLVDGVVFPQEVGVVLGLLIKKKLEYPFPHTHTTTHKHTPLSIFLVIGTIAYGGA